jgi:hypothetical protein
VGGWFVVGNACGDAADCIEVGRGGEEARLLLLMSGRVDLLG